METLPPEIITSIAERLNPAERWRLSATSRSFRELFPVPLRIRIVSPGSHSALKPRLYVSPASNPAVCLSAEETLKFGEEYYFWTYDYERQNRTYLGRHGQKKLYNDLPQFLYTLGLRPVDPNQTWKVYSPQGRQGDSVPFDESVGLDVGGKNPQPHRPDSDQRLFLSAHTLTKGALWYVIQDKWSTDEELHLMRCQDYVATEEVMEKEVILHAIPDILDGGYSLYSPQSLKQGKAACELFHANVKFEYWIEKGMMYFHATAALDFAFGVPILEEDNVSGQDPVSPLKVLLKKNSSRWWATKHYMSNAADIIEGVTFNMEAFMRSSKDHEDHTIVLDKSDGELTVVYIEVQEAVVDKKFPELRRDESESWQFLLCA
jgi:hypothetical protein